MRKTKNVSETATANIVSKMICKSKVLLDYIVVASASAGITYIYMVYSHCA